MKSVFAVVDDCLGGGVRSLWSTADLAEKERDRLRHTNPKAFAFLRVKEVEVDKVYDDVIWEFS